MKTVFYLKTCGTCTKIMNQFDLSDWEKRELKSQNITPAELETLYQRTKSYESLFSKRSTQIKKRDLNLNILKEEDFKDLILDHYSFLKRPIFVTEDALFVGNDAKTLESLQSYFK